LQRKIGFIDLKNISPNNRGTSYAAINFNEIKTVGNSDNLYTITVFPIVTLLIALVPPSNKLLIQKEAFNRKKTMNI